MARKKKESVIKEEPDILIINEPDLTAEIDEKVNEELKVNEVIEPVIVAPVKTEVKATKKKIQKLDDFLF